MGVSVHTGRVSPGFSFLPGQSHRDQAVPGIGGCWDRTVRIAVLLVLAEKTCQQCQHRIICENQEQVRLMELFEFLMILLSIIVGLGLAELLRCGKK